MDLGVPGLWYSYGQLGKFAECFRMGFWTGCVQPALDYFNKMFDSNLEDSLLAFKAARHFSPHHIKDIQPDAEAIYSVSVIPFLDSQMVLDALKQELPTYLPKVIDLDPAIDVLE